MCVLSQEEQRQFEVQFAGSIVEHSSLILERFIGQGVYIRMHNVCV